MYSYIQRNFSAYGHGASSYTTVTRWIKRFKSGIDTLDSAPGKGRSASVVTSNKTDNVNDLLKIDEQMTTPQVARCVCISTGSTYKIPKKKYELAVLLLGGYTIHCLMAKRKVVFRLPVKMLKKYPHYNQSTFSNIWTVDET